MAKPRQPGSKNLVITGDIGTVGTWGGTCTCPDGEVLLAGEDILISDRRNMEGSAAATATGGPFFDPECGPLACEGGTPGLWCVTHL